MSTFYLKHRDTLPPLEVVLLNPDGSVHDLSGATSVTLHIRLNDGQTISREMDSELDDTGLVSYEWQTTDWTVSPKLYPGEHRMEYEVLAPAGRLTFPNGEDASEPGYDTLSIADDIGQA